MSKTLQLTVEELKRQLYESKQENKKLAWNNQNQKTELKQKNKIIANCKNRIDELESYWNPNVLQRGGTIHFMHSQNNIEQILNDDSKLRRTISITKDRFADICAKVAERSRDDDRLFYEDGSPRPGNRCRLTRDQTVYMSILLKKADPRQVDLEMQFGVHQSTVSRAVEYIDCILVEVLPTAKAVQQRIKDGGATILDQFVPDNEHMTDATEFPVERPHDNEMQQDYYSGKKKRHTAKATIIINKNVLIIFAGPIHNGKTHDMAMLRLDDPDFGMMTKRMKSTNTPEKHKQVSWSDMGYEGVDSLYPGIVMMQPIKRPRKKKDQKRQELSPDEKRYNKQVSRIRIKVEHVIGWLKHYTILRNVYVGSDERLYRDLQIVSGLINHRMLWDKKEKKLKHGF